MRAFWRLFGEVARPGCDRTEFLQLKLKKVIKKRGVAIGGDQDVVISAAIG